MGIRVHKVLGYGLDDLGVDQRGYQILDPRIQADFDTYPDSRVGDYLAWLELRRREGGIETDLEVSMLRSRFDHRERMPTVSDAIAYSPEYGLNNVLVFSPLSMGDWRRFDDPIDWIEEGHLRGDARFDGPKNRVDVLRHGPFPWSGKYMNWHTGEDVGDEIMYWIRATNTRDADGDTLQTLDTLAEVAGFEDHAQALELVRPVIPNDVRNLTAFLKVFAKPDGWRHLQPMIYTYWS